MSSGCPNGGSSAALAPTARPYQQPSNPAPAPTGSALKRPRYDETENNIFVEPQTVVAQERLAPAAGGATSTAPELVSLLTEKEPILEGLEAFTGVQALRSVFSERYAKSAPLQQHENFSSLPVFRKAATEAREASFCSPAPGDPKAPTAPLASAPDAYPRLEEHAGENNNTVVEIPKEKKQRFCTEPEMPSAILLAAASYLYHTTSTNSSLRISAAAHFMNLLLRESPGKAASWKDICSWAAFYGIKTEDLRAAVGLVGKEGVILEP
ncbi:hypothetical protein Ndes2526A_g00511 [Nannochloris sp. 'desiccata']